MIELRQTPDCQMPDSQSTSGGSRVGLRMRRAARTLVAVSVLSAAGIAFIHYGQVQERKV